MSDELINSNQDDLSFDFHYWKHENKISKLFFEALELRKKIELERLSSLAYSDKNPNDKLIYLGGYTASINVIDSILNSSFENGRIDL